MIDASVKRLKLYAKFVNEDSSLEPSNRTLFELSWCNRCRYSPHSTQIRRRVLAFLRGAMRSNGFERILIIHSGALGPVTRCTSERVKFSHRC